jgi:hypothetical protein
MQFLIGRDFELQILRSNTNILIEIVYIHKEREREREREIVDLCLGNPSTDI